jgi:hypothetical protein
LRPPQVELDATKTSPVIQTLYKATRETKEQPIIDRLEEAKKLIEGGTDLKATDDKGRTALHWAVFGSSYALKPKVLVEYEEVADERRRTTSRPKTHADTPSGLIGSIRISTGNATGFRRTCCSRERQPDIWM